MHAMRTGAWTAFFTLDAATASGEEAGSTRPIASSMGSPSITPAPRKNVRRGIFQLVSITSLILFRVETMLEREAGRDLFEHDRSSIVVCLQRFHRPVDDAFVEPI